MTHTRTRTAVIIALILTLLAGVAGGVAWWVTNNAPSETTTTTPTPVPEVAPEPEVQAPEPTIAPEPDFTYTNFCNADGVADYQLSQGYLPLDFTTASEVTAPIETFSPLISFEEGARLMLVDGCENPVTEPQVTFTPIDVDPEPCRNIPDEQTLRACAPENQLATPMASASPSNYLGFLPEWFTAQELYEIQTAFGFDSENGQVYDVFAAAGTWQMDIAYEGKNYSLTFTVPQQF